MKNILIFLMLFFQRGISVIAQVGINLIIYFTTNPISGRIFLKPAPASHNVMGIVTVNYCLEIW